MDALKMTNNLISSMTRLDALAHLDSQVVALSADSAADSSELAQLARLNAVLASLEQLLSAAKTEDLPQVCREVTLLAHELSTIYSQSVIGSLVQDAEQRRTTLRQIRRRLAFCGAVLRRWRRVVSLRRQALDFCTESATYAPALVPVAELK